MKKAASWVAILLLSALFAGCAVNDPNTFDTKKDITVITREAGSGTRGAFVELLGIEQRAEDGTKTDRTTTEAIEAGKTGIVLTSVAGDPYAIGYISLGSLNDTVKALHIDGVQVTAENVKNGTYKIARPFNIATRGEIQPLAQDFIDYIFSQEGQQIIEDNGYIAMDAAAASFAGTLPAGRIVLAGSSSVTPVMEKLAEAYKALNSDAQIEIQMSDSTAGMTGVIDGICDIGMASRALKESELAEVDGQAIAMDGIAVIVHNGNPTENISADALQKVYIGDKTTWED